MLTGAGAKLLDFGLAKAPLLAALGPASTLSFEQRQLTAEGAMIGTFQYMSPEQLEGHASDVRTDIFAFGTLLYEMATGRKAFDGKSQAGLIASILTEQPEPISAAHAAIDAEPVVRARSCRRTVPREESGCAVANGARFAGWSSSGSSRAAGRPRRLVRCGARFGRAKLWHGLSRSLRSSWLHFSHSCRRAAHGRLDPFCGAVAAWHHDWHRREPHTYCHLTRRARESRWWRPAREPRKSGFARSIRPRANRCLAQRAPCRHSGPPTAASSRSSRRPTGS